MIFKYSCFIRKNTSELRKKLEELGYNRHPSYNDNGQYLYLNRGFYHTNVVGYSEEIERMIDCGTNEELFLALAALRDDTDKNQWFICIKDLETAFESFYVGDFILCKIDKFPISEKGYFRKATVKEIFKHFNK